MGGRCWPSLLRPFLPSRAEGSEVCVVGLCGRTVGGRGRLASPRAFIGFPITSEARGLKREEGGGGGLKKALKEGW